jgi:hypothetical protein
MVAVIGGRDVIEMRTILLNGATERRQSEPDLALHMVANMSCERGKLLRGLATKWVNSDLSAELV